MLHSKFSPKSLQYETKEIMFQAYYFVIPINYA